MLTSIMHHLISGSVKILVLLFVTIIISFSAFSQTVVVQDWRTTTFQTKYKNTITIAYRLTRSEKRYDYMANRYKYLIEFQNYTIYKGYQVPVWIGYSFYINDAHGRQLQYKDFKEAYQNRILESSKTQQWNKTYYEDFWEASPDATVEIKRMGGWIGTFLNEIEDFSNDKQETFFKENNLNKGGATPPGAKDVENAEANTNSVAGEHNDKIPTDYKPQRTHKGQIVFYYREQQCDPNAGQTYDIDVYVDGKFAGKITSGYPGTPICGNVTGITLVLPAGQHYYRTSNNHSGVFEIKHNECKTMRIDGLSSL